MTDSADVKQYIKRMRARDAELNSKWGTICTPVVMLAPDGKKRKTQAADLEGIFRIIQSIPSKKAEPVRQWLAELGSQRIDQIIDPELTFQMAVEVATTEYSRQSKPQTMAENQRIAQERGSVARDARQTMERRLGRSVVSPERTSDYIKPIEGHDTDALLAGRHL